MDTDISEEIDDIHVSIELMIVYQAKLGYLFGVHLIRIGQVLVQVSNQVLELWLELVDIILDLFSQHLLSFSFPTTWVPNETRGSAEYQDGTETSQSEVIQDEKAHVVANMDGIRSGVHS